MIDLEHYQHATKYVMLLCVCLCLFVRLSIRLIHAVDYDGRICGVSDGVHGRPNAYYMTSGAGEQRSGYIYYSFNVRVSYLCTYLLTYA